MSTKNHCTKCRKLWAIGEFNPLFFSIIIFGDGLAEPVGIRFGRHKYETYAFFQKRNMFVLWREVPVFFLQVIVHCMV